QAHEPVNRERIFRDPCIGKARYRSNRRRGQRKAEQPVHQIKERADQNEPENNVALISAAVAAVRDGPVQSMTKPGNEQQDGGNSSQTGHPTRERSQNQTRHSGKIREEQESPKTERRQIPAIERLSGQFGDEIEN